MSNLIIGYQNHADMAVLAASPAAEPAAPVLYLQLDHRGLAFQSTTTATQTITGDWSGATHPVGAFGLFGYNLSDDATVRLELFSDVAMTSSLYDTGAVAAHEPGLFDGDQWEGGHHVATFAEVAGVKAFRITIEDATNPWGYFEIGRLYLGPVVTAPRNPMKEPRTGRRSTTKVDRAPLSGARIVEPGGTWRRITFELMVETEADRATWSEIAAVCGRRRAVLVSLAHGLGGTIERDLTLYGAFEDDIEHKVGRNRYDFGITVEEV